jgi:hypothetical protein
MATTRGGHPPLGGAFTEGAYRRRIRLITTGLGEVHGGLEDDFHHFEVTIRCDDDVVTDVEGRAIRFPWTTCPDAVVPLHDLEGMPLSDRFLSAGERANPRANCTHLFDLAGLAIAHAARGGALGTTRQYDAEVPAMPRDGSERVVKLWRDGRLAHTWILERMQCIEPAPFSDAPWRGGFFRWANETFGPDEAEAVMVLRRAIDIGMGRGMDLDAVDRADELEDAMGGVCFTMQPEQIHVSLRNKGTVRDFDEDPNSLLS